MAFLCGGSKKDAHERKGRGKNDDAHSDPSVKELKTHLSENEILKNKIGGNKNEYQTHKEFMQVMLWIEASKQSKAMTLEEVEKEVKADKEAARKAGVLNKPVFQVSQADDEGHRTAAGGDGDGDDRQQRKIPDGLNVDGGANSKKSPKPPPLPPGTSPRKITVKKGPKAKRKQRNKKAAAKKTGGGAKKGAKK